MTITIAEQAEVTLDRKALSQIAMSLANVEIERQKAVRPIDKRLAAAKVEGMTTIVFRMVGAFTPFHVEREVTQAVRTVLEAHDEHRGPAFREALTTEILRVLGLANVT